MRVHKQSIIKCISLNISIRVGSMRPSLIRKGGLEILLSLEMKTCVERLKYLERIKEIVQLNLKKTEVKSLEIGDS